jgi:hypothetical protein
MKKERVLRTELGPNREEVRLWWRKLHTEELHNLPADQGSRRAAVTTAINTWPSQGTATSWVIDSSFSITQHPSLSCLFLFCLKRHSHCRIKYSYMSEHHTRLATVFCNYGNAVLKQRSWSRWWKLMQHSVLHGKEEFHFDVLLVVSYLDNSEQWAAAKWIQLGAPHYPYKVRTNPALTSYIVHCHCWITSALSDRKKCRTHRDLSNDALLQQTAGKTSDTRWCFKCL